MKRIIVGILSIIYITLTSGIVMNIHYCMGKLSTVNYSYRDAHSCSKCGMENKKGCCHSDFTVIKISDDQQSVKTGLGLMHPLITAIVHTTGWLQTAQGINHPFDIHFHPPPDLNDAPVYLQNRVFRI